MYCFTYIYIYIRLSFCACVSIAFFQPPHEALTFVLFFVSNLAQTGLLLQTWAQCGSWVLKQVMCMSGDTSVGEAPCELHLMWVIFGDLASKFVLGKLDI